MRKAKLYAMVSMDGYLSCCDSDIDWILEQMNPLDTDYGRRQFQGNVDTIVMTADYYITLLGYDMVDSVVTKPCIIAGPEGFRGSNKNIIEHITIARDDYIRVVDCIESLKLGDGGDIWIAGDHKLIWAFIEAGTLDEIMLTMLPVKLGEGVKLFSDSFYEKKWHPWDKKYYNNDVIQVTYRTKPKELCS